MKTGSKVKQGDLTSFSTERVHPLRVHQASYAEA